MQSRDSEACDDWRPDTREDRLAAEHCQNEGPVGSFVRSQRFMAPYVEKQASELPSQGSSWAGQDKSAPAERRQAVQRLLDEDRGIGQTPAGHLYGQEPQKSSSSTALPRASGPPRVLAHTAEEILADIDAAERRDAKHSQLRVFDELESGAARNLFFSIGHVKEDTQSRVPSSADLGSKGMVLKMIQKTNPGLLEVLQSFEEESSIGATRYLDTDMKRAPKPSRSTASNLAAIADDAYKGPSTDERRLQERAEAARQKRLDAEADPGRWFAAHATPGGRAEKSWEPDRKSST